MVLDDTHPLLVGDIVAVGPKVDEARKREVSMQMGAQSRDLSVLGLKYTSVTEGLSAGLSLCVKRGREVVIWHFSILA
jgi:hypothetical protein